MSAGIDETAHIVFGSLDARGVIQEHPALL